MAFAPRPGPWFNSLGMLAVAGATGFGLWQYWKKRNKAQTNAPLENNIFPFGEMRCSSGKTLHPIRARISGKLRGLLVCWTISQEFASAEPLIYTFSPGANTLLDLEITIDGQGFACDMDAPDTEERLPFRLRKLTNGLYGLRSIPPGKKIGLRFSCAGMLDYKNGGIEIRVPGKSCSHHLDTLADFGMRQGIPHYPYALELALGGFAPEAGPEITGPKASLARHGRSAQLKLESEAPPDEDFIARLAVEDAHALCAKDGGTFMAAASFQIRVPAGAISPVALKILLDCSGSASGSGLEEVRAWLPTILDQLGPDDFVSFSRFGTDICHLRDRLVPANPENRKQILAALANTRANMGGTRLLEALCSTFGLEYPHDKDLAPCLLLLSDGDVLNGAEIAQLAQKSGQRVFVLGLGQNPDEGSLRALAKSGGGFCEVVGAGEKAGSAIGRIFGRMREGLAQNIGIAWRQEPIWQSDLPAFARDGDTAHVFARLKKSLSRPPELSYTVNGETFTIRAAGIDHVRDKNLGRLGHLRQSREGAAGTRKQAV